MRNGSECVAGQEKLFSSSGGNPTISKGFMCDTKLEQSRRFQCVRIGMPDHRCCNPLILGPSTACSAGHRTADDSHSIAATRRMTPHAVEFKDGDAVDELLQTYGETGGINYLDAAATLPSREAIEVGLRRSDEPDVPRISRRSARRFQGSAGHHPKPGAERCTRDSKPEICKSLGKLPHQQAIEAKGRRNFWRSFISQLPEVRKILWTDIDAAYEGDPAAKSYEEIILAYPALEAIAI